MKKVVMFILIAIVIIVIGSNMPGENEGLSDFIEEQTKWIGEDRIVEIVEYGKSPVNGLWFTYIDKYDGHIWYCCSGIEAE